MSPNGKTALQKMLMRQEGYKQNLYKDINGHITGGFGHNFDAKPLSEQVWIQVLIEDTQDAIRDLVTHLPWYTDLNEARQSALVSMVFNEGIDGVMKWRPTLDLMQAGDWQAVHDHILASDAGHKEHVRYAEIAQIFLSGEFAA